MKDTINVCFITDMGFYVPTVVSITSIKSNKKANTKVRVHCIVTNDVGDFYINKLKELNGEDFEIRVIKGDASHFNDSIFLRHCIRVPVTALLKFELAYLLTDVDKCIYIDGDTLICKDLGDLYNHDLKGNMIMAVRDMRAELFRHYQELLGIDAYFNSGIMLLNLDLLRKEHSPEKFIDCKLHAPNTWNCMDQDSLNFVTRGRALYIEPKYNLTIPLFKATKYTIQDVNDFFGTTYQHWDEADDDAVILHFAGCNGVRPWEVIGGVYAAQWEAYYLKSPLRNIDLHRPTISMSAKQSLYNDIRNIFVETGLNVPYSCSEIVREIFKKLTTFRIVVRNVGKKENGVNILSDDHVVVTSPMWLMHSDGSGKKITGGTGTYCITLKAKGNGTMQIQLQSEDFKVKGESIPIWINYSEVIIDEASPLNCSVWSHSSFSTKINVVDEQEVKIRFKVAPLQYSREELSSIILRLYNGNVCVIKNIDSISIAVMNLLSLALGSNIDIIEQHINIQNRMEQLCHDLNFEKQQRATYMRALKLQMIMPIIMKKYRLLQLKKCFSWGSRRKRYKQKITELRFHIREYRQLLRQHLNLLS